VPDAAAGVVEGIGRRAGLLPAAAIREDGHRFQDVDASLCDHLARDIAQHGDLGGSVACIKVAG
jgi:hypothetical protein